MTPLEMALQVLLALPSLLKAGRDVLSLVESTTAVIQQAQEEKRPITDSEWNAVNSVIRELQAELHKPDAP